ncbi:MAG: carboxypeptidase regulatory-like domain-containing protein [Terracidiphilus sp.]|jgi:hypothetical protein
MNQTKQFVFLLSLMLTAMVFTASGQTTTAITGRVLDGAGAVIQRANVTAHNELTSQDIKAVTTSTGDFTFSELRPGIYDVSATAPGFDSTVETGVNLHVDAVATVNLILRPGSATESITVHADEAQLDLTHPSRGEVFTQDELEQSPFNAGNPILLVNTEPGVMWAGTNQGVNEWVRPFDYSSINQFRVNGGISDSNDFQIDGSPNNSITFGARNIGYVPPTASLQEMKVIINPYDAQYGHTGGGIIDMVTKYGGNTLHGQVYENARRTWLDANEHFNGTPVHPFLPKIADSRNQFGFELDGPVVIPHLYDGHDKTFFATQLEIWRETIPASGVDSVPALSPGSTTQTAWQTGDFSGAYLWNCSAAPNCQQPVTIYNPFSVTTPGLAARTPFANNFINPNLMDPTAKAILSYLPLPNVPGIVQSQPWGADNYVWSKATTQPFDNVVSRIDRNFGDKDRTYIRFAWSKNWQNDADYHGIPGPAATGVFPLVFQSHTFATDWQHVLAPNSVFGLHLTYQRFAYNQSQGPSPFDLSKIGLGGLASSVSQQVFPQISIAGVTEFGNWADNGGNKLTISNTISAMPMWTWEHGAHTVKIGVDYRLQRSSTYYGGAASGKFADGTFWTQQNNYCCAPVNQGLGLASFALGVMDSGSIDNNTRQYFTYPYYAPFFQDDWKARKNLTINLGFRWDFQGPPTESRNKVVGAFDTTDPNVALNSQVNTNLLPAGESLIGGMTYAGVGQPRTLFNRDKLLLQPRLGFNYALNNKTVIRGGIGLTYVQFTGQGYSQGFSQTTNYVSSTDYGQTVNGPGGGLISNPFPTLAPPAGASLGMGSEMGDYFNVVSRNFRIPGAVNYSFGVERQIGQHTTVDLSYVGTQSFHGDSQDNINHVSAGYQASCNIEMSATVTDMLNCENTTGNKAVPNPFQNAPLFSPAVSGNLLNYYYPGVISAGALSRPYPQFGDITQTEESNGVSEYDSVQAVVSHNWSNALVFHGNLVWSKMMEGGGWADEVYRVRQHFIDTGNPAWRIAANVDWHIPVGKGRKFLGNTNRIVDEVIGNWVIGGTYFYQAGVPSPFSQGRAGGQNLEILNTKRYPTHYVKDDFGNQVIRGASTCVGWHDPGNNFILGDVGGQDYSDCASLGPNLHKYDYVVRPFAGVIHNVSDSGIRLPRNQQLDVSMSKSFPVWKAAKLQVRFEGYNVMNHPSWSGLDYWWFIFDTHFGTDNKDWDPQTNQSRNVQLSAKIIW